MTQGARPKLRCSSCHRYDGLTSNQQTRQKVQIHTLSSVALSQSFLCGMYIAMWFENNTFSLDRFRLRQSWGDSLLEPHLGWQRLKWLASPGSWNVKKTWLSTTTSQTIKFAIPNYSIAVLCLAQWALTATMTPSFPGCFSWLFLQQSRKWNMGSYLLRICRSRRIKSQSVHDTMPVQDYFT